MNKNNTINLADFLSITELATEEIFIVDLSTNEKLSLLSFAYENHISSWNITNISMDEDNNLILHVEMEEK